VGHENLRIGEAFDKPHLTSGVLLTSTGTVTNVMTGHN